MKKDFFLRFLSLLLLMVAGLECSIASAENVTGTFEKVTSGSIDAGTYIFVGNGNSKALINNTISGNWIYGTSETYTGSTITNPSTTIVWTVDASGKIQPYGSTQYLYSSAAKSIALDSSKSTTWSFSLSNSVWNISGKNGNTSIGNLTFNSTGWRPYTGSTGTAGFQIYKLSNQQTSYTVTYDANGGSGTMTDSNTYNPGATVTVKANEFTREGYTFAGWKDQNGNVVEGTFTINANTTLYAQWAINTYDVTWKVNGNVHATTKAEHGGKPAMPTTAPTSADFDGVRQFVGWTAQTSVTDVTDAPADLFTTAYGAPVITADGAVFNAVFATVTGGTEQWVKQTTVPADAAGEYVIVADGSTHYVMKALISSNRFANGTNATIVDDKITSTPSSDEIWTIYKHTDGYYRIKNGSNFAGGTSSNSKGALLSDEDADLAKWEITYDNGFTVKNKGREDSNPYLRNNGSYGWAPYAASTGNAPVLYKKVGGASYSNYAIDATFVLSSITVNATDAKTEYVLGEHLDVEGVKVTANYSNGNHEEVTTGITFDPADGTELTTAGTQTVTVTYGGKSNTYEVTVKCRLTYDANGGSGTVEAPTLYANEAEVTVASGEGLTLAGYTFSGWNTAANGSGTSYTAGNTFNISSNVTLYAQWTKNPCTVKFEAGSGSCATTSLTEASVGAGVQLPSATAVTGWEFVGWATETVEETTIAPSFYTAGETFKPDSDCTLFAVYSRTTSSDTGFYLSIVKEETTYYMGGRMSGKNVLNAETSISNAAVWGIEDGCLYYMDNGSKKYVSNSANNSDLSFTDSKDSASAWIINEEAGNITFKWTDNTNTRYLGFNYNSGSPRFGAYADNTTYPHDFTKTTAATTTYNTTPDAVTAQAPLFTEQPEADTIVTYTQDDTASAITVAASGEPAPVFQWYSNTVKSTENAQDVNGATSTSFTPSTAASGTTYYFCVASNSEGSATSNIVTVVVNKHTYTLTYDANGGDNAPEAVSAEDGSSITIAGEGSMNRAGHTFAGWNTAADGSGHAYAPGDDFPITADVTLYAQWTINSYTVSWQVNGRPWGEQTTVNYGAKPTLPAAPASADFDGEKVFMGWSINSNIDTDDAPTGLFSTAVDAPEISDDTTFHAVFASASSTVPTVAETVGFERSEGYTAGNTYNQPSYSTGSTGSKWTINYGNFSGAGATHGSQNAEFRIYKTGGGCGQLRNTVPYEGNISAVSFYGYAANAAGKVVVAYSANGSSWTDIETVDLTKNDTKYTLNVPGEAHYIKFTAEGNRLSSTYGIYIDDVEITVGTTAYSGYVTTSDKSLSSISVDESAAKLEYAIGEKLDVTGVVVTAHYSDESSRTVTSGITYSPAHHAVLTEGGEQTVTVTYGGKSATYTVNVKCGLAYDANGGEGSMETTLCDMGATVSVAANSFTREHYHFTGWNTAANGSGDAYDPGASITLNVTVTLYAQWALDTFTVTYNANGGTGTMTDEDSPYEYNSWVSVLDNKFERNGYKFSSWNTAADGSGDAYSENDSFRITSDITLYAQWSLRSEESEVIFHEGFGDNTNSARDWSDSYKEQSGVSSVYSGASYTITNAKQSKNTMGSYKSGLTQTSGNSDSFFEVGPLNLSAYTDGTDVTLSYKWKATSVGATYYTKVYYKASSSAEYTEISNTAEGATSFVEVKVDVPTEALTSTAYFKVVFNTSNAQAVIDEFDLSGKQSKAVPNAYFDLPVHFVYAADEIGLPEHVSVSEGAVIHVAADPTVAAINHDNAIVRGGDTHSTSTVVTATIAETDDHTSATASYVVKVVPSTVSVRLGRRFVPFSNEYNLDFKSVDNLKAYAVNKFDVGGTSGKICAIIKEIYGQEVPAKNGVILEGTPGITYEVPVLINVDQMEDTNFLVGALKGEQIPNSDDNFYRFLLDDSSWNYILLPKDTPAATPSHNAPAKSAPDHDDTAYIEVPATLGETLPDSMPLAVMDDNGVVTGVEDVVVDAEDFDADAVYYNLQGLKMPTDNLVPGFYIKVKGRQTTKVYIK